MDRIKLKAFLLAAATLLPVSAAASNEMNTDGLRVLIEGVQGRQMPASYEDLLGYLMRPIRMLDKNRNGLELAEVETVERIRKAQIRTQMAVRFLPYDLNDDHRITMAEVDEVAGSQIDGSRRSLSDAARKSLEGMIRQQDVSGDGILDWSEMTAVPKSMTRNERDAEQSRLYEAMAKLDPNEDGRFTSDEARTVTDAVFARFDGNGDGLLTYKEAFVDGALKPSRPDLEAIKEADHLAKSTGTSAPSMTASCEVPKVPSGSEVVLIGAYEAVDFSSVHFGRPFEDTGFVTVQVETGKAPLYVVASSFDPIVWKFEGDVGRIENLILSGRQDVGGAIGLDQSKVTTLEGRGCFGYDFSATSKRPDTKGAGVTIGQKADHAGGKYALDRISIPSMNFPAANRTAAVKDRKAIHVEPSTVVSSKPARPYDVLPGHAGLAQLVESGNIEKIGGTYRIVKPIAQFPSGLHGAYSVRFELAYGVPMPAGDPGHSCVIIQETGQASGPGGFCR